MHEIGMPSNGHTSIGYDIGCLVSHICSVLSIDNTQTHFHRTVHQGQAQGTIYNKFYTLKHPPTIQSSSISIFFFCLRHFRRNSFACGAFTSVVPMLTLFLSFRPFNYMQASHSCLHQATHSFRTDGRRVSCMEFGMCVSGWAQRTCSTFTLFPHSLSLAVPHQILFAGDVLFRLSEPLFVICSIRSRYSFHFVFFLCRT